MCYRDAAIGNPEVDKSEEKPATDFMSPIVHFFEAIKRSCLKLKANEIELKLELLEVNDSTLVALKEENISTLEISFSKLANEFELEL